MYNLHQHVSITYNGMHCQDTDLIQLQHATSTADINNLCSAYFETISG